MPRKCGLCKKEGHNRKNCENAHYKGEYNYKGERHGNGVYEYKLSKYKNTSLAGSKYEGDWVNGKREGKGLMCWSRWGTVGDRPDKTGYQYNGEWKNDMMHGDGTMTFMNDLKYEGKWKFDQRNGKGMLIYNKDYKCELIFKDGKICEVLSFFSKDKIYDNSKCILMTGGGDLYEKFNKIHTVHMIFVDIRDWSVIIKKSDVVDAVARRAGEEAAAKIIQRVWRRRGGEERMSDDPDSDFSDNSAFSLSWDSDLEDGSKGDGGIDGIYINVSQNYIFDGQILTHRQWRQTTKVDRGYGILTFGNGNTLEMDFNTIKLYSEAWWGRGKAIYTCTNGLKYERDIDGAHTITYPNGDKYHSANRPCITGTEKPDFKVKKKGKGVMTFVNGDTFRGEWCHDNIVRGEGVYVNGIGVKYEGKFKAATFNGKITYETKKYSGQAMRKWTNRLVDNFLGRDPDTEIKFFEDPIRHGEGVMVYADGAKYNGEWEENKKHGKGEYETNDGVKYIGTWTHDLKDHVFIVLKNDKFLYSCKYVADELVEKYENASITAYPVTVGLTRRRRSRKRNSN